MTKTLKKTASKRKKIIIWSIVVGTTIIPCAVAIPMYLQSKVQSLDSIKFVTDLGSVDYVPSELDIENGFREINSNLISNWDEVTISKTSSDTKSLTVKLEAKNTKHYKGNKQLTINYRCIIPFYEIDNSVDTINWYLSTRQENNIAKLPWDNSEIDGFEYVVHFEHLHLKLQTNGLYMNNELIIGNENQNFSNNLPYLINDKLTSILYSGCDTFNEWATNNLVWTNLIKS
ncbi:MAG: hypothetical protein LBL60_02200 [Mycoplasmataceae bacterium]|jgi:virulence family protein|nr:hypothetical protein [Mycoplasmataceae bacterium]